ncbi:MAG TPA: hypothetical protein VEW46_17280 [Pyrinomonadaceae bacterium]|nr:hypothetical protein [Pyrinomonadaceae bacterium]
MATPQDLITFYDNYKAPLPAGSYRLVLQQSVSIGREEPRHYYRDQSFEVLAPRYSIEADDIQAYFPPEGGVADYNFVLPHLVLGSRNLPWERTLSLDSDDPWLALLVLSEREIVDSKVVFKRGTVADLAPHRPDDLQGSDDQLRDWWQPDVNGAVLLPRFTRTEDANTPVGLLDVSLDLFLKLCPTRKELPLLAHIRHVATDDKVPLEMVANGEFSVLVAQRFPPLGANTVYLVSLEGWNYLLDAPDKPQPHSRARLITLASWSFVNDPTGHDTFGGLMQRLKTNSAVFGITAPTSSGSSYVDQALQRGYIPLDYKPRQSTPTFAWYRGPLAPIKREQITVNTFERADAAMIVDPNRGIIDTSYACAWELGRLTALSSPAFVKGLRLFVEQKQNVSEFTKEIERFVESHRSSFTDPISGDKKPNEQITLAKELIEWIARLVLLYPVPFHYLVPHQSLLPSESLRFFHLDDNWVDALLDGALSIAIRDIANDRKASRAEMQSVLSKIVYQHRLRLQGKNPEWNPSESYMGTTKSGFLLRSRIVTGWPGVEVTAKTSATQDQVLPNILRFDQIADGVLFCLARGTIEEVRFREPREGITFGVGSNKKIKTKSSGFLNVKDEFLRSGPVDGVVDIAKLQVALASVGSAEFATQMILKPEEQSITWSIPR